jgi:hypothetical protein
MDQATAPAFVQIALPLIRERLVAALSTAERAEAILRRERTGSAVRAILDVEVLTYDANTLLNAASLVNRLAEQDAGDQTPPVCPL